MLHNSLYKANIILILKNEKVSQGKEYYRSIFFINIEAVVLKKILEKNPATYKKDYIPQPSEICPRVQGWLNVIKSIYMIHHIN